MKPCPQWMIIGIACGAVGIGVASRSAAAGIVVFAYGMLGCLAAQRRRERLAARQRLTESLDGLAVAAADMRAGVTPEPIQLADPDLQRLAIAAQRASDRSGAPLADLWDRLETEHRNLARAEDTAHAQEAGIRATTLLLVLLPLAALGLGHVMGANAWATLLRTPLGTVCVSCAVALQLSGVVWADRLVGDARLTTMGRLRLVLARHFSGRQRRRGRAGVLAAASARRGLGIRLPANASPGVVASARWINAVAGWAAARQIQESAAWQMKDRPDWPMNEGSVIRHRAGAPHGTVGQGSDVALHAELAFAADLIAAALRAGSPVSVAVLTAADVLSGPLTERLLRVGHSLRLGAGPDLAWVGLADLEAARGLIRAANRSADSGAALARAFVRCADEIRARAIHERQARLQRRAVFLVLPLGMCFLPAFLLAGLVPVVVAVLGGVL